MNFSLILDDLREKGLLPRAQAEALQAIVSGRVFSLFLELRALFYLGVIFVLAGLGWIIRDYFAQLGPLLIVGSLSAAAVAALAYCFVKAPPYANGEAPSPNLVFDYILYLGCSLYSLDLAYIETQFHLFGGNWPFYLLLSSAGFFLLAYRFDNQLVLSLALSALAAYFGFKLAGWQLAPAYYRSSAILFGLSVLALGLAARAKSLKPHFFDLFANFAAHFLFLASLSGVAESGAFSGFFLLLVLLCFAATAYSLYARNFLYLFYAALYGYLGTTFVYLRALPSANALFLYFVLSPLLVGYAVYKIYLLARAGGADNEPL
jgi:hypothetical protein